MIRVPDKICAGEAQAVAIEGDQVACGFPLATARAAGALPFEQQGPTSAGVDEPAMFSELDSFLVRLDPTPYFAIVQRMPLARPHLLEIDRLWGFPALAIMARI